MVGARSAVVERLAAAGCVAAEDEAAELIAAAPDGTTLDAWVSRREQGEPLAWITGQTTFCGRALRVARGVYVPRPQTEELARRAAALLPAGVGARARALDLCTGTGAVAAHLRAARPEAFVMGTDCDEGAARCARSNGVPVVVGDLDGPVHPAARFDVVTAVPPYVPTGELAFLPADVRRFEPAGALDGGPDGLAVVRRIVDAAARRLRPDGWLLLELGGDQDRALRPTLTATGFDRLTRWCDEDGDLRGLAACHRVPG